MNANEAIALNANEVIAAWKEPDVRGSLAWQESATIPPNPAGLSPFESDPANCASGASPAMIGTIGGITTLLSCTLVCSETMWDGSCDFFSYGCC
jgi:mersacidin/lichenicidin family type 2 lantibiotic